MKKKYILPLIALTGIMLCVFSCKKDAVNTFSATINGTAYTFDSLFAWVDTSSAQSDIYFINVGAKDTKNNNLVYLAGIAHSNKQFTGTYFYINPLPYPVPASYQWLNGIVVNFASGNNKGIYRLTGSNTSKLSVTQFGNGLISGDFLVTMNPSLPTGATDVSQTIQMSGSFSVPYHTLP